MACPALLFNKSQKSKLANQAMACLSPNRIYTFLPIIYRRESQDHKERSKALFFYSTYKK